MARLIKKAANQAIISQEEGLQIIDQIFKSLDPNKPQDRIPIDHARDLISKAGERFKDAADWIDCIRGE